MCQIRLLFFVYLFEINNREPILISNMLDNMELNAYSNSTNTIEKKETKQIIDYHNWADMSFIANFPHPCIIVI